jgi:hypothetical protein
LQLIVSGYKVGTRFARDGEFILTVTEGGYSLTKDYDLSAGYPDYDKYLAACHVVWDSDGIRFIEPAGYEYLMPASEITRQVR